MKNYRDCIGEKTLGYTIDEYVGSGQYGVVYKAHSDSGQVVAVKKIVIPTEDNIKEYENAYSGDRSEMEEFFDQIAQKFVSETESMKMLSINQQNDNIIRYIDHRASKHDLQWEITIVMEFATPLREYLKTTPIDVETGLKLGIDIANGLNECHKMGIIHRDIKEDNIFVDKNGTFKIGDFGAAKLAGDSGTKTRGIGSLYYMAPEIQNSGKYTPSVDIYSLGIVLYKVFNYGRFPFTPTTAQAKSLKRSDNDNAFKRRMNGDDIIPPEFCPKEAAPVIVRACTYDPKIRYALASELASDLKTVRTQIPVDVLRSTIPYYIVRRTSEPAAAPAQPSAVYAAQQPPQQPSRTVPPEPVNPQQPGAWQQEPVNPQPRSYAPPQDDVDPYKTRSLNHVTEDPWGGAAQPLNNPDEGALNDEFQKTTDLIQQALHDGNVAMVRKLQEKLRMIEEEQAKIRMLREKKKRMWIIIAAAGVVAVLASVLLVILYPYTFEYKADKADRYYIHKYQFGIDRGRIQENEEELIPADYVDSTDDEYIYFSYHDDDLAETPPEKAGRLYRIRKDGTGLEELVATDDCEYDIYYEGYVYYLSWNQDRSLCRINPDSDSADKDKEILYDSMKLGEPINKMSMPDKNGIIEIELLNSHKIQYVNVRNDNSAGITISDENPVKD